MTYSATQWRPNSYETDTFTYDKLPWKVGADYSHSFKALDATTFRFEVRKGDRYTSPSYSDPAGLERSEMGETTQHAVSGEGQHFATTYKFMIEPGAKNTADWMVIGQLHDNNSRTPPFEITMVGERMQIVAKYGSSNPVKQVLWTDSQDLVRGKWYDMKIDLQLGPNGGGHVHVWRDGKEIVDFSGKIGYTDSNAVRWKHGIYRDSPANGETIALQLKDLDVTYGTAGHSDSAPTPTVPAPTPEPAPTPAPEPAPAPAPAPVEPAPARPVTTKTFGGGSANNTMKGTSGNDLMDGRSGHDKIWGKGGSDVLIGGAGKDSFTFDTMPSSKNVDVIVDFNVADDTVRLDDSVFTKLKWGALSRSSFVVGEKALDSYDRIIYNDKTGALSYDADGTGSTAAVKFAVIENLAKLTAADFIVI